MISHINIGFHSKTLRHGKVNIHFVHNGEILPDCTLGKGDCPILLLLHGFPEYYGAWQHIMPFLADDFLIIAPDQRGFNLSSAPQEVESYETRLLVGDMLALLDEQVPDQQIHLVGHDWGASVAYALAINHAERFSSLTVINGVHPYTFQHALVHDNDQIAASQYFHVLCAQNAAVRMSENDFALTFSMFEKFSSKNWLSADSRQGYLEAWSRPGRMNAMLNWYRASPMVVPFGEEILIHAPILDLDRDRFKINLPHQVLWGLEDTALLPVARMGLEYFVEDLKLIEFDDAGHWINHTHAEEISTHVRSFIGGI